MTRSIMSGARTARRGAAIVCAALTVSATLASSGCGPKVIPKGGSACVPPGAVGRPRGKVQVELVCTAAAAGSDSMCTFNLTSNTPSVLMVEPTIVNTPVAECFPVTLDTTGGNSGTATIFATDETGTAQTPGTVSVSQGC